MIVELKDLLYGSLVSSTTIFFKHIFDICYVGFGSFGLEFCVYLCRLSLIQPTLLGPNF